MTACPARVHAVAGVEAQDDLADDAGVAETPRLLVGASDGGHRHVGVQAARLAVRKRAALRLTGQARREGTGVMRHCSDTGDARMRRRGSSGRNAFQEGRKQ